MRSAVRIALAMYNDMRRYILSVIDVISKFLHLVPVKTKRGSFVASAFRSIFHYDYSRFRRVWLRTDKSNEFHGILRDQGIQFEVCKNPDVKCAHP